MMQTRRGFVAGTLLSTASLLGGCAPIPRAADLDILIKGGRVVDGSGAPAQTADVGIVADRIVSIARNLSSSRATTVIDARGLVVAPGFIDPHVHISNIASLPVPQNFLRQGITTLVNSLHSLQQPYPLGAYISSLRTAQNTVWTAGHTWLREHVLGLENRDPT